MIYLPRVDCTLTAEVFNEMREIHMGHEIRTAGDTPTELLERAGLVFLETDDEWSDKVALTRKGQKAMIKLWAAFWNAVHPK